LTLIQTEMQAWSKS